MNQTYKNFEIIVVDNYSDYNFFSHIESFNDKRIRAFQNQNNGIIAVNRNIGIKKAKGEYLAFCDDDDIWMKDKLKKQIEFLNKNNEYIGVASTSILFGNLESIRQQSLSQNIIFNKSNILNQRGIVLSSLVIKNSEILFSEDSDFAFVEDFELLVRLMVVNGHSIMLKKDPLVYYRVQDNNSTNFKNRLNKLNVIDKYKAYFKDSKIVNIAYSNSYSTIAITAYHNRLIRKARTYVLKSIKFSNYMRKPKRIFFFLVFLMPMYLTKPIIKRYYKSRK